LTGPLHRGAGVVFPERIPGHGCFQPGSGIRSSTGGPGPFSLSAKPMRTSIRRGMT
jgi:hypothetical protein